MTVSLEEMAEGLQEQTAFYLKIIEVICRELVLYGVGVSNPAAATRAKHVELGLAPGYIRDLLKKEF